MTSRPTGFMSAPPTPCSTRMATSIPSEVDAPHSAEETVKTATAAQKTVRAPNRSAIQPLTGMKTARLRRYDVMARLSRSGLSPRLAAICGSDVAMMVWSSASMKSEQAHTSGMRSLSRGSSSVR